ncbi:S8 family peptidase [Roseovarius tibetensis]|uniref:S8 family peptidase n=1 Tax=Roseovarius tibetensis TaxID=2685897 RepID=UPI003D7F58C0
MAERPLLGLLQPNRTTPKGRAVPIQEKVAAPSVDRQAQRVGPKFDRLSQALPDAQRLAALQDDPAAIAPERALVFEIASTVVDFHRALSQISGLELLGEDEDEVEPDDDFATTDKDGNRREDKAVPRRLFFTLPDAVALRELVSLWNRYKNGEEITRPHTEWKRVFAHLSDIRPWGPQDRVTEDAKNEWLERLRDFPDDPVRFEVEFWYRATVALRDRAHQRLAAVIGEAGGQLRDRATIPEIRYDAALVEVRPEFVQSILDHPDIGLAAFDEVMVLRPQSLVTDPHGPDLEDASDIKPDGEAELAPPVAALLDGMPMAQHQKLADRLEIDDPDDFAAQYGQAAQQVHGTSMASLILHGDLNSAAPTGPVTRRLYVRPVMYPQQVGFDAFEERMPPDKLAIDLIWRAFLRMFEGEGDEEPTAPTVRIVNMSLGDLKRRFAGVLSPWARLIDYLAWQYGVLVLVSAGNIPDAVPLEEIAVWSDFEDAAPEERETILLKAILRNRAYRRLLAPSEGLNSLTIGAAHFDEIGPNGAGAMAVDPYASPFLPNPSSAQGLGYLRGVKPELLLPGGREHIRTRTNTAPISVTPVLQPGRFFGIGAAAPGTAGETSKKLNFSGTSVATAVATHGALRILEALEKLPVEPPHPAVDPSFHAVVLKALLVHAAKWDPEIAAKIEEISKENGTGYWEHRRDDAARLLGFGVVDIDRVIDCAENRATLIGWNTIHAKETDEFRIPIPAELENLGGFRAVTATAAWLSPLNVAHRMYRMAKLDINHGGDKGLSLGVGNAKDQPSHNAYGRGTVFHRRWAGDDAKPFVDDGDIVLNVSCKPSAGDLDVPIPYAVAVTFEVGATVPVAVYERVRERLRQQVAVPAV